MHYTKILLLFIVVFFTTSSIVLANDLIVLPDPLQSAERANYSILYSISKLDVLEYFDLNSTYDTDLKRAVYRKTPEYSEKYNSLLKLKSEVKSKSFYVLFDSKVPSYDIKRRGFEIDLGSNSGRGTDAARAPKSYEGFLFDELSTKTKQTYMFPKGFVDETFFLPMSETEGLIIETNRDDAIILFRFKVSGTKTVKYRYFCWSNEIYRMSDELLSTKDARVIIANIKTGDVYYNQAMTTHQKEKRKKKIGK